MAVIDHIRTEKQRGFNTDFLKDAAGYETWDGVKISETYDSEQTFEVKLEDILSYSQGVLDPNPIFNDPNHPDFQPHPLFCVPIAFWCIGKGHGSWIRSPGAINPGQKIELLEPFRVGDVITIKQEAYDRWVKRGRHYVTYKLSYYDQRGTLKAIWWGTLIIPPNRQEMLKYARTIETVKGGQGDQGNL